MNNKWFEIHGHYIAIDKICRMYINEGNIKYEIVLDFDKSELCRYEMRSKEECEDYWQRLLKACGIEIGTVEES